VVCQAADPCRHNPGRSQGGEWRAAPAKWEQLNVPPGACAALLRHAPCARGVQPESQRGRRLRQARRRSGKGERTQPHTSTSAIASLHNTVSTHALLPRDRLRGEGECVGTKLRPRAQFCVRWPQPRPFAVSRAATPRAPRCNCGGGAEQGGQASARVSSSSASGCLVLGAVAGRPLSGQGRHQCVPAAHMHAAPLAACAPVSPLRLTSVFCLAPKQWRAPWTTQRTRRTRSK
jgi:hypothetical protein